MKKREARHLATWIVITLFLGGCGLIPDLEDDDDVVDSLAFGVIGAEGGTLQASGVELVIPPGALDREVEISIESAKKRQVEGLEALSPFFRFEPSGIQFNSPIAVTLDFSGDGTPKVYWSRLGDEGSFDEVGGAIQGSRIQAQISHFSVGFVATKGGGGGPDLNPEESCEAKCRKREETSCLPKQGRDYDNCMEVCTDRLTSYTSMYGEHCESAIVTENICFAERLECENGLPTLERCEKDGERVHAYCFLGKSPDSVCETVDFGGGTDPMPCPDQENYPIKMQCFGSAPDRSCVQPAEIGFKNFAYCCAP